MPLTKASSRCNRARSVIDVVAELPQQPDLAAYALHVKDWQALYVPDQHGVLQALLPQ